MGWTIILENENKEVVSALNNEFVMQPSDNTSSFKLLHYLDAYGDTIFNRLQMDDLIQDLNYLRSVESHSLIEEIQALAERCKMELHMYLVFYGD